MDMTRIRATLVIDFERDEDRDRADHEEQLHAVLAHAGQRRDGMRQGGN
ncbi:hypothetical protein J8I87_02810 [Paraburkholderia sp. LEh10]|jgi:hypothetical protein|nr:hypothetical protein [Paraburkholderia sp. LEh10]